jgi:hypothetical protein
VTSLLEAVQECANRFAEWNGTLAEIWVDDGAWTRMVSECNLVCGKVCAMYMLDAGGGSARIEVSTPGGTVTVRPKDPPRRTFAINVKSVTTESPRLDAFAWTWGPPTGPYQLTQDGAALTEVAPGVAPVLADTLRPKPKNGAACTRCGEFNEYAEPNQPDGTFKCFQCRTEAYR